MHNTSFYMNNNVFTYRPRIQKSSAQISPCSYKAHYVTVSSSPMNRKNDIVPKILESESNVAKQSLKKRRCKRKLAYLSCVTFALKQHEKPLSLRRGVCLTCDVDLPTLEEDPFATVRNWGRSMRNSPWNPFLKVEAYCLDDPKSEEGMPDMDPPKQPHTSYHDDDGWNWGPSSDDEN